MFPPSGELMVERARREHRRPGLFIGRLGRCPGGEIFVVAALIRHVGLQLTSLGHIAMASTCPRAGQSTLVATLVARRGGDHGATVDVFTMREERGEMRKEGCRGVSLSSCHR